MTEQRVSGVGGGELAPLAPDEPETFYAIRRTDGEPVYDGFMWLEVGGPDDWTVAEDESDRVEFEIVRMLVEPLARRTYPLCLDCDEPTPATHWGLCEKHAREDDPTAFDDGVVS